MIRGIESLTMTKTWKTDFTTKKFQDADKYRKALIGEGVEAKVKRRADDTFHVRVVVEKK